MDIGVITLLRGDPSLTKRWIGLAASVVPGGSKIVAMIPGTAPLQTTGEDTEIVLVDAFSCNLPPNSFERSAARCDYIADLYNKAIPRMAGTNYTLLFEDDIIPPADGVERLRRSLEKAGEDVAGIVSVYPIKEDPRLACLAIEEWGLAPEVAKVPRNVFPIFSGGVGFSLWRTSELIASLPIRRLESVVDWDSALSLDVRERGRKILCEGGVRCRHER